MTSSAFQEPDLEPGECRVYDQKILPPDGVRFLPGGRSVVLGQLWKIEIRHLETGAVRRTIEEPSDRKSRTAWALDPRGDRILCSEREGAPRLIDLSGEERLRLELPADAESYLASESPGLASFGAVINGDGTTEDLTTIYPAYGVANDVAFLDGGDRAALAYGQAYALIWDMESGELLHAVGTEGSPGEPIRIYRVAGVEHGRRIATLDSRRVLRVVDLPDPGMEGKPREAFSVRLEHDPHAGAVDRPRDMPASTSGGAGLGAIAFTPDGERIAAADAAGVRVWDVATGDELAPWDAHGMSHPILGSHKTLARIHHIGFSADGRRGLTVGVDATIRLWDVESGSQIWAERPDPCCIDYADISPDGRYVFWAACPGMRLYAVG